LRSVTNPSCIRILYFTPYWSSQLLSASPLWLCIRLFHVSCLALKAFGLCGSNFLETILSSFVNSFLQLLVVYTAIEYSLLSFCILIYTVLVSNAVALMPRISTVSRLIFLFIVISILSVYLAFSSLVHI
jgi:hypothetical protein